MQTSSYDALMSTFRAYRRPYAGCRHTLLTDHIQELTLGTASQNTITEWVRCLDTVVRQASPRRGIRVLTDARTSVLPELGYVSHLAELIMLHPFSGSCGRFAILHEAGPLTPAAQAIADALLGTCDEVRFFAPDQRDEALNWLAA